MSTRPDPGQSTLFDDLREAVEHRSVGEAPGHPWPLCGTSAMLRTVLLVLAAQGLGLSFVSGGLGAWVDDMVRGSTVALPGLLAWQLLACGLGRWLRGLAPAWQSASLAALGALAGGLAWWVLNLAGLAPPSASGALAPALAGAALAWLLWQSVRWRQRARLPATAAARLADLQTRIRPHFLFNTLNTAIALVQHDPRRAEEVLEDLSELFRAALGVLDKPSTLGEEIALSRRYLSTEQLRFGERLRLRWDLDPSADSARLPSLALQPLVENAVRHGVEPGDRGGAIEIRSRRLRDRVLVSVTNTVPLNGHGRPGHGIGLASVRERLHLLHDLEADFRSGIIEDGRWRVSFSVPAA